MHAVQRMGARAISTGSSSKKDGRVSGEQPAAAAPAQGQFFPELPGLLEVLPSVKIV